MESRKAIAVIVIICAALLFSATAEKVDDVYKPPRPTIDWSKCFSPTYRPGETSSEACATIVARQTRKTPRP